MPRRPVIGLTPNLFAAAPRSTYTGKELEFADAEMARAVRLAGGLAVMLCRAHVEDAEERAALAAAQIDIIDGLLLTGGADVDPGSYGCGEMAAAWPGQPGRDAWEIALYRAAVAEGRPVLGACRGVQVLNVAEGGTLWQDLPSQRVPVMQHKCRERYDDLHHELDVVPGTVLEELFADEPRVVNSVHHQGVREVGASLEVMARSPDGLVEAVRRAGTPWVVGVQWHPEWMVSGAGASGAQMRLFEALVAAATEAR